MIKIIYVSEHNYMEVCTDSGKLHSVKGTALATPPQVIEMDNCMLTFKDGTVKFYNIVGVGQTLMMLSEIPDNPQAAIKLDDFDTQIQCEEVTDQSSPLFDDFPLHQTVTI